MPRLIHILLLIPFISACGGSDNTTMSGLNDKTLGSSKSDPSASDPTTSDPSVAVTYAEEIALANSFCINQKKLQTISTSLLSAYTPTGNGSDLNYCGGENIYSVDGPDFSLRLNDYCVNARGQNVLLNGDISGTTESGSNFTSTINSLNITGDNFDMDIIGSTRDGRADDNFVSLQISDNRDGTDLILDDVSIKKGEFDFGYVTFDGLKQVPFKFITYFNADNTEGLLFIYGDAEERIIISGDAGMITAVYTKDRHDPGTWLDLPCNN